MAKKIKKPIIVQQVEISGMADKGKGVGRDADGRVLFVENVAPGDIVDVHVTNKKPEFMEGYAVHYHSLSEERIEPFCQHFNLCGGCRWMHINYPAQLFHKELIVKNALQRIGKVRPKKFLPILPCDTTTFYRNKLEYAFSNKRWLTKAEMEAGVSNLDDVLGYHRPAAFDKILDIKHCWLQADPSNDVRDACKEIAVEHGLPFYDLRSNGGIMRHVMIRLTTLGELMVIVSFHLEKPGKIKRYLDALLARCPQITSLFYCINPKLNDYVGDLEMILHAGKPFIEEQLGHVRFKIGPKSFFQTNSRQAKNLYDQVVEFAGLTGQENVYDLYTGVGSIALYVAKFCRHVVGIEEVPEAIV
ncbi:MAG: 23S rRNA (uracil(1939)-C(5))-methyltransferase RlmD, partial [Bacteroidota bacterium]